MLYALLGATQFSHVGESARDRKADRNIVLDDMPAASLPEQDQTHDGITDRQAVRSGQSHLERGGCGENELTSSGVLRNRYCRFST
jgi:hypothetical protein